MTAMRDYDGVAVPISLKGGTHLLSDRMTNARRHGSDLPGIGGPRHGLYDGRR
jgi:hypothetical protein